QANKIAKIKRYIAKETNEILPIKCKNVLIAIIATTNAVTKPTANNGKSSHERKGRLLYKSNAVAPIIIGTAKIKEYSAAAFLPTPINNPPEIVAPEREKPGNNAKHWNSPIANA